MSHYNYSTILSKLPIVPETLCAQYLLGLGQVMSPDQGSIF